MLRKLNCMNYHVEIIEDGVFWYAQNGLRSIYTYAKLSKEKTFKQLCIELYTKGQSVFTYELNDKTYEVAFTMI